MNKLGFTVKVLLVLALVGTFAADAKKKPNKYGDGDFEFVDEVSFPSPGRKKLFPLYR